MSLKFTSNSVAADIGPVRLTIPPQVARPATPPLERRILGRLGRTVTSLGLGGAGLHGVSGKQNTDARAIATVHAALEAGINYIDTSPGYGESERRLGLALRGYPRERLFLATKTGTGVNPRNYTADHTYRSVERSLQRLGTDHLDLLQVHDPDTFDEAFSLDGALGALIRLKEQKVIRGIGIGVRDHALLLHAIRHGAFDTILTYGDFNLAFQSAREDLFEEAQRNQVAIILGSPLFFGWLSDVAWDDVLLARNSDGQSDEERRVHAARRWAERRGLSKVHLSLQYCMRESRISTVLVGAETPEQMRQSIKSVTTPLPDSVWTDLSEEMGVH